MFHPFNFVVRDTDKDLMFTGSRSFKNLERFHFSPPPLFNHKTIMDYSKYTIVYLIHSICL